MPGELSNDKSLDDPLNNFKIKTDLNSLDITLNYLDQYFNNSRVGIYKDLSLFSIQKDCDKNNSDVISYYRVLSNTNWTLPLFNN